MLYILDPIYIVTYYMEWAKTRRQGKKKAFRNQKFLWPAGEKLGLLRRIVR